jgi:hypothetical protein
MSLYLNESGQRVDALSSAPDPSVVQLNAVGTEVKAGAARVILANFTLNSIASGGKATLAVFSSACRPNSAVQTSIQIWDGTPIVNGIPVITLSAPASGVAAIEISNFGANATGTRVLQLLVQFI